MQVFFFLLFNNPTLLKDINIRQQGKDVYNVVQAVMCGLQWWISIFNGKGRGGGGWKGKGRRRGDAGKVRPE